MSRKKDKIKGTNFWIKTMKNVAFHNLGCKVNSYEMEAMQQNIQKHGYNIVQFTQKADIYIVNTCTVTNIADRKSRQMLHRAKQLNPDAVVVAVGCYAQTGMETLEKDPAVDIIVGNNHKSEIVDIIEEYLAGAGRKADGCDDASCRSDEGDASHMPDEDGGRDKADRKTADSGSTKVTVVSDLTTPSDYEELGIFGSENRTRADVKIQDGCNQFCSYCAIPLARGRVRSRRPDEIIDEIKRLAANGHREIVLTGIHICSYGIDFDDDSWKRGEVKPSEHEAGSMGKEAVSGPEMMRDYRGKTKLFDLVEMIDRSIPPEMISRIRLGSLEPRVVTPENVRRLVGIPRICPHFHLSLQSGCDETLKRMNRHYTTDEYKKGVDLIREEYRRIGKNVAITTDVIVGFPGETEEEFEITRRFLDEIRLYEMHIFKYSRRKGTVADRLEGQITEEVKGRRSDVLLEMTKRHSDEYRKACIGKKLQVLIEEEKKGVYYGHTADYVRVGIDAGVCDDLTGREVVVKGKAVDNDTLIGEVSADDP